MDIKKKVVYGDALISNRCYWQHYIDVKNIKDHFTKNGVRVVDSLRDEFDNLPLCVFVMK